MVARNLEGNVLMKGSASKLIVNNLLSIQRKLTSSPRVFVTSRSRYLSYRFYSTNASISLL